METKRKILKILKKTGSATRKISDLRNEGSKKDEKGTFNHETLNLLLGNGDMGRLEFVVAGGIRFRQLEPNGGSATSRPNSHPFEQRWLDALCMGYNRFQQLIDRQSELSIWKAFFFSSIWS